MKFANYYYIGGVDMKYEKILVAVDGSPVAERAAVFAADIAESLGAVMDLLYISCFPESTNEPLDEVSWLPDSVMRSTMREAEEAFSHVRGLLPESALRYEHERSGVPAEEIIAFAKEKGDSIIVIGSHGLGPVSGLILGSVSQKVVEEAPCSVIVVK